MLATGRTTTSRRPGRALAAVLAGLLLASSAVTGVAAITPYENVNGPTVDGFRDAVWENALVQAETAVLDDGSEERGFLRVMDDGANVYFLLEWDAFTRINAYGESPAIPAHCGFGTSKRFDRFSNSDQLTVTFTSNGDAVRSFILDYVDDDGDATVLSGDGEGVVTATGMSYSLGNIFDTEVSHNGEPGWEDTYRYEFSVPRVDLADIQDLGIDLVGHISPHCAGEEVGDDFNAEGPIDLSPTPVPVFSGRAMGTLSLGFLAGAGVMWTRTRRDGGGA